MYCERSFPNLRFDGDFLQVTKCFLQPQQKSCGQQLSSKVPSSVAILLEQQLNPPKLIRHFCVGSLAKYWSGGRRTCRTRSYGPAAAHHLSLPVPTMILPQAHNWMIPPPQFTVPGSYPPSSYSVPPHSSYPHAPWSVPYYILLPPTIHPAYPHTYPISLPFLHSASLLPPSGAAGTAVPPTVFSQLSLT